nr:MAG: hypothetical protein [Betatorquevirus sp.]
MSKFLKPTIYKNGALETQWMNSIFTTHDIVCGCQDTINHLKFLIENQQCHSIIEGNGTTTTFANADINAGDLERLFAEDEDNEG